MVILEEILVFITEGIIVIIEECSSVKGIVVIIFEEFIIFGDCELNEIGNISAGLKVSFNK